ncbi:MAG: excinuclease ABC subunit UvrA [bacterium]|nr:excinuclease ABC subunit UvrA [bacterium]
MNKDVIRIEGAREHNLKNISVEIPRNQLVVITGISGSGKSSLAFDTIYAEGQRRYVESLSAYARQFLGLMEKPDVDKIEGLSPAIAIQQKQGSHNPRSTVATVTEIYDYLRLLFARIGVPFCPKCGKKIERQTPEQIVDQLLCLPQNTKIVLLAPLIRGRKGEYKDLFEEVKKDGFLRVRVDGIIYNLDEPIRLTKNVKHTIEVIVDRLKIDNKLRSRLIDSVETSLKLSSGLLTVVIDEKEEKMYSERYACIDCSISLEEPLPRLFSFNSPYGACATCSGIGTKLEVDPEKLIVNPTLTVKEGALAVVTGDTLMMQMIEQMAKQQKFDVNIPWEKLQNKHQKMILYGTGNEKYKYKFNQYEGGTRYLEQIGKWEGIIPNLHRRYQQTQSEQIRTWIESFMGSIPCTACNGKRLKPEALAVKIQNLSIADITTFSIQQAKSFFEKLVLTEKEKTISNQILKEIHSRLNFLINVGLDYLTLNRTAGTLSGGEAQRIQLATQIGSQLVGVLYILDEPSIGLHQRDNVKLINTLMKLRELGNTVIVVEHDEETIRSADYVIDMGPKAGRYGGEIVAKGTPLDVSNDKNSLTGQFLSGKLKISVPKERRKGNGKFLKLLSATGNNLKNVNLTLPLGMFIAVTGVSGSGKSSLITETLTKALAQRLNKARASSLPFDKLIGIENLDKVIEIDQSPIGRTPRSNPATYTQLFGLIRDLFAQLPEAKIRGYTPGRFSFNVKGGRCDTCEGDGIIKIEMFFLPDVYVTCEACSGKRYNRETLEVRYKGKSIADILELTVEEALDFFSAIPRIRKKLQTLYDVGLGYIHLGQQATTLSGGEAQRVKLATELSRAATGKTIYILDEPTTGLHFADIQMLLKVLQQLVDKGNTVVVIEHNLDVIKIADWIIDLGPEGGDLGGTIIAEGTPETIAQNVNSYTGQFLKKVLDMR